MLATYTKITDVYTKYFHIFYTFSVKRERTRGPKAGGLEYFHDANFKAQQPKHVFL